MSHFYEGFTSGMKRSLRRVPHEFGLMAGKDSEAVRPWCITQLSATQQDLVGPQRHLFGCAMFRNEFQSAFVGIERVVRVFGAEGAT